MPAAAAGMDGSLVEAAARCAADRLARHGAAGQLVVLRAGRVVLDRAFGAAPRSLFLVYSCSKVYVALVTHLLVERGLLSLDEPVSARWPEFGRRGKQGITPRHVLVHRAGVPDDNPVATLVTATSWEASVRRMEALTPRDPPGSVTAYHALTYGWILGELARRVTGTPIQSLLREALLAPLGLDDTFLGLPAREWSRAVRGVPASRLGLGNAAVFNRRRYREAVVPAVSVSTTARDLARLLEALRRGGELDGVRVLGPASVAEARRPPEPGPVLDTSLGRPVRWSQGFHLGGVTGPYDQARFMGELSAPDAFGCIGADCCTAWVDPGRELVFAYLTGMLLDTPAGIAHHGLVADCVLRACG